MKNQVLLLVLIPVNQKNDDTIRSKSDGGSAYAKGWDAVFAPKTPPSNNPNVN